VISSRYHGPIERSTADAEKGGDRLRGLTLGNGFDRHHGPPLAGFAVSGLLCLRRFESFSDSCRDL